MGGVAVSSVADVAGEKATTKSFANNCWDALLRRNNPTHGTILQA
jgi:hypothetical protein